MNIHKICNPIQISFSSVYISTGQSSVYLSILALILNNPKLTCCLPELRILGNFQNVCLYYYREFLGNSYMCSLPPSPLLLGILHAYSLHCHVTKHNRSTGEHATCGWCLNWTLIPNICKQLLLLRRFISYYTSTGLNLHFIHIGCLSSIYTCNYRDIGLAVYVFSTLLTLHKTRTRSRLSPWH